MSVVKQICHSMWSVTPYAKCDLRCHYCCTQAQGRSEPPSSSVADITEQVLGLPDGDTVIFGALSDSYPNAEAEHEITRHVLIALAERRRPVVIVTKGTLILRDVDVLRRFGSDVLVQVSICTLDDAASVEMEPGAAPSSERLDAVQHLHREGVPVEVNALPWIPDLSDISGLLRAIPDDVVVNISPLATPIGSDERRLLNRTYHRADVIERYLAEYERLGSDPRTSWVRPAEEGHHHPLVRLDRGARVVIDA